MIDVFKVRFDEREWWALHQEPVRRLWLYGSRQQAESGLGNWTHGFSTLGEWPSMVERIEELPPEPPVGTVLYDDQRGYTRTDPLDAESDLRWTFIDQDGDECSADWRNVNAMAVGQLHPYPRAAREEIEQLVKRNEDLVSRVNRAIEHLDNRSFPIELGVTRHVVRVLRGTVRDES